MVSNLHPNSLYSVLNVPPSAPQSQINERHRALSLIFHPDKQPADATKATATAKFLEVQKAYQVLSDPFLRQVYDTLGEEGLSVKWPEGLRTRTPEEIQHALKLQKREIDQQRLDGLLTARGQIVCAIDSSSLFGQYLGSTRDHWPVRMLHRLQDVRVMSLDLRHSVQRQINDSTRLDFVARVSRPGKARLSGAVRHQFSPRLSSEATFMFFHPHILNLAAKYRSEYSAILLRTTIAPTALLHIPPALTASFTRRLFRDRLDQGTITFHAGRKPHLSLNFIFPAPFDYNAMRAFPSYVEHFEPGHDLRPPSISGLNSGTSYKSFGFSLNPDDPNLSGEWGLAFTELAVELKVGLECGLRGLAWFFSGSWASENWEASATTYLNTAGVVLKLECGYLGQKLALPIVLAQERNAPLTFWTVVVPSTTLLLGYHFVLKPRRRARRLAHIRAARRSLEKDSDSLRERDAVVALLKDTARKHKQTETSKEGLVILEATYGAIDIEDGGELVVDVTVPLQALTHNSQLVIPAHQPKSNIQGFCDPAPFAPKALRVRYLFRGQVHFAEIPDFVPVVLPLADHLVAGTA